MADTSSNLGWYRVALNTIVRKGMKLDSERLRILPMGSRVNVVEIVDRRARIDQPVTGWCSIKSSNGDTILNQLGEEDMQSTVTPLGRNEMQNRVENANNEMKKTFDQLPETIKAEQAKLEALQTQLKEAEAAKGESDEMTARMAELQDEIRHQTEIIQNSANAEGEDVLELAKNFMSARQNYLQQAEKLEQAQMLAEAAKEQMHAMQETMRNMVWGGEDGQAELPAFRPGDVVMLKDNDLGMAIVRSFQEDQLGLEFSVPIGDSDGNGIFEVEPNCAKFVAPDAVKMSLSAEQLLVQLEKSVATLQRMKNSKE